MKYSIEMFIEENFITIMGLMAVSSFGLTALAMIMGW